MLLVNPQGLPGFGGIQTMDAAAVASGQVFLEGQLEKMDPKLYEPLISVTWMRDVVVKTGGGYVDYTSNFFPEYGTVGANQYGLMAGESNALPVIQGNISKDVFPVNTYGYIIKVPFLDQARMTQIGRSLEDLLQNGLRLNYDKMLDQNAYFGMTDIGQYGLINNPQVAQQTVAETGTPPTGDLPWEQMLWRNKTPEQILDDVNSAINRCWARSEYDLKGMPNHILIPPDDFAYINGTLISTAGSQSILSFLLMNNTAKAQGVDLVISPCRQCISAGEATESGTSGSGRMVTYVNREDMVFFDETVPLTRVITQPSAEQVAYLSTYVAKVGVLKFMYYQPVDYADGISQPAA
jgi:hypothetical protein